MPYVISLLLLAQWWVVSHGTMAPTNLLATRIGPCIKGKKDLPVVVAEMSIHTRIYDSSLTGNFNVTVAIENGWRVKVTMQKCQDIRNLDTCDPFRTYLLVRSACTPNTTVEDEDLYGMVFHHTVPKLSCPVQPGQYNIVAYPFFTEDNYRTVAEAKISTSVFGYTYKIEGFLGYRPLFCVEAFLQLLYVREYNWMSGTSRDNPGVDYNDDGKPDDDADVPEDKGDDDEK